MSADERSNENEQKRDRGLPGGGVGRRESTKGSPIYPASGPLPPGDAIIMTPGDVDRDPHKDEKEEKR